MKLNKKCDNLLCYNQVIRVSDKKDKRFCDVCEYAYKLGYNAGYNKIYPKLRRVKIEN